MVSLSPMSSVSPTTRLQYPGLALGPQRLVSEVADTALRSAWRAARPLGYSSILCGSIEPPQRPPGCGFCVESFVSAILIALHSMLPVHSDFGFLKLYTWRKTQENWPIYTWRNPIATVV